MKKEKEEKEAPLQFRLERICWELARELPPGIEVSIEVRVGGALEIRQTCIRPNSKEISMGRTKPNG